MTTLTPVLNATGPGHVERAYPFREHKMERFDEAINESANADMYDHAVRQTTAFLTHIGDTAELSDYLVVRQPYGYMPWMNAYEGPSLADIDRASWLPRYVRWCDDELRMAVHLYGFCPRRFNAGTNFDPCLIDTGRESKLGDERLFTLGMLYGNSILQAIETSGASRAWIDAPGWGHHLFGAGIYFAGNKFGARFGYENAPGHDHWWKYAGRGYIKLVGSEGNDKRLTIQQATDDAKAKGLRPDEFNIFINQRNFDEFDHRRDLAGVEAATAWVEMHYRMREGA